jgi:hypothetical protein
VFELPRLFKIVPVEKLDMELQQGGSSAFQSLRASLPISVLNAAPYERARLDQNHRKPKRGVGGNPTNEGKATHSRDLEIFDHAISFCRYAIRGPRIQPRCL